MEDRTSPDFEPILKRITSGFTAFLLYKNKRYGNSINKPVRIFSRADTVEQIYVRIDDKLSRLKDGQIRSVDRIPTIIDLVGYLLILLYNYTIQGSFDPAKLENYGKEKGVTDEKEIDG